MSPLDDARRLMPEGYDDDFCGRTGHESGCPWLSMPKIVEVLEAAERLADRLAFASGGDGPWMRGEDHSMIAWCCNVDLVKDAHAQDCPYQALVDALKSEAAVKT